MLRDIELLITSAVAMGTQLRHAIRAKMQLSHVTTSLSISIKRSTSTLLSI